MKRMRKFFIFILFAVLFSAIAYGVAGGYLNELLSNARTGMGTDKYFFATQGLDDNTYVLGYRDGLRLVTLNRQGRLDERALVAGLPDYFMVDDLHVTQEGGMLLSLYEYGEDDALFYGLYIADSSLSFAPLLREECSGSTFQERRQSVSLSSISEYDGQVRLLLKTGSTCKRYLFKTASDAALTAEGSFRLTQEMLAAIVAPDGTAYVALAGGALMEFQGSNKRQISTGERLYTRFWQSANGFCFIDGKTGSLVTFDYQSKQQTEAPPPLSQGLPCRSEDITSLSVGVNGDLLVLAAYRNLYAQPPEGGLTDLTPFLYSKPWQSVAKLTLVAILILVLSYGFYYLFCEVRKLYFPIVPRSVLVLGLAALILVYAALGLYIQPAYRNHARGLAHTMLTAYTEQLAENGFDLAAAAKQLSAVNSDFDRTHFYLLHQTGDVWRVARSSNPYYGEGFALNTPGILGALAGLGGREITKTRSETLESAQTMLYAAYVPTRDNGLLVAVTDGYMVEAGIAAVCRQLALLMYACALIVVLAAALVLGTVAWGLRRVTGGVDLLGAGNFDVNIIQESGDELEALARAFNNLVGTLNKRFLSDKRRSDTYLQFIPQQLVSLMGAGAIEEVNKNSTTSRDLTMMVVWFSFPDPVYQGEPQTLFDNINEVIERTAGVVAKHGGTIYNFTYDSYEAVFDSDPQTVISTAVKIRQVMIALNQERAERGQEPVTLRIAIDKGHVMMGVVGDDSRMVPTAVSASLNTVRMLVDLAKTLDANILCSMTVAEGAKGYSVRYIGKGHDGNQLIRIYELFDGDDYEVRMAKEKTRQQFSEGVYTLYGRDFEAAKRLFMDIARYYPGDGAARYYLHLADKFATQEPAEVCLN